MNNLKLITVHVDLCAALSSLQVCMVLNDQDETAKRQEKLRYIEKVLKQAKDIIKELK